MTKLTTLLLLLLIVSFKIRGVQGTKNNYDQPVELQLLYHPFVIRRRGYGLQYDHQIYRGGGGGGGGGGPDADDNTSNIDHINTTNEENDDYDRAEKMIVASIERLEAFVERIISNEVDVFFHKDQPKQLPEEKEKFKQRVKKAITEGVTKMKTSIKDHAPKSLYPFESSNRQESQQHKDHRLLNAIEAAERAVLHAIEKEVDTLFHNDIDRNNLSPSSNHPAITKAGIVKDGVQKASTFRIDQVHDHRRDWLRTVSQTMIEEYTMPEFFID